MPKIFISYRRADSAETTNRLYDRLAYAFGRDNVFKDVDSLQRGDDFPNVLQNAVQECDVFLSIIGQRWLTVQDEGGQRRLDNPKDWVRQETEMAVERGKKCLLIPTLVDGAQLPKPEFLPHSLVKLTSLNNQSLDPVRFHEDVSTLITFLRQNYGLLPPAPAIDVDKALRDLADLMKIGDLDAARDVVAQMRALENLPPRIRLDAIEKSLYRKVQAKERERAYKSIQPLADLAESGDLPAEEVIAALEAFWRDYPEPAGDDPANYERFRPILARKALQEEPILLPQAVWQRWLNPAIGLGITILISLGIVAAILSRQQTPTAAPTNTPQSAVLAATVSTTNTVLPIPTATLRPTDVPSPTPTETIQPTVAVSTPIGVTHNADWTPVEKDFNGVTMVEVPAGCFDMGNDPEASDNGTKGVSNGGHVCFDNAFWIDKTEVTNAQFAQFGGKATNPNRWTDNIRPRETLTWFEGRDFCALREGRLPTEAEWEYAARGPDNLIYPWGNEFVGDNVVYSENSNNQTATVGSKPQGSSWVGALDLSGNVSEWVSTLYQFYPYPIPGSSTELQQWINNNDSTNSRLLRGGSWHFTSSTVLRAASRDLNYPLRLDFYVGFRCAVSDIP